MTDTRAPLSPELAEWGSAALAACRAVLQRVTASDLGRATPCTEYSVAEVGDHLERSMVLLAGSAGAHLEPLGGATLDDRIAPLAEQSLSAWQQHGVDGSVPLGSRTLPAANVYDIVLLELVIHSWDVSRALGAPTAFDPPADLVEHLIQQTPILIRPEARGRAFAEPAPVAADASALDRLVAFTGRAV